MKKCDILLELVRGGVTEEQADQILDSALADPLVSDVRERLGFSGTEWTAYGHGALLSDVAGWRRYGWPTQCAVCGKQIEVARYGWLVTEIQGMTRLKHVSCMEDEQS